MSVPSEISNSNFSCLVCSLKFEKEASLRLHLLEHLKANDYQNFDIETALSFEDQKIEIDDENQFSSKILTEVFYSQLPKYKEIFACSICGKEFRRKDHLNKHYVTHSDKKSHVCFVCGKGFARKDRLKDHCVIHMSNGWSCYSCGKMFPQRCILQKHEMIHRGIKPFSCELCDAKFSRKNDLTRHATSHTGEKSYLCEVCGKAFSQKRLFKRHALVHSNTTRK